MEDNIELRRALADLDALQSVVSKRKQEFALDYYTPNPIQFKAHQSKARIIIYSGGNRSGKSTLGAVELAWHLTKKYPTWYPRERRFYGPIKAVIVAESHPMVERVIEPKIKTFIPKDWHGRDPKRVSGNYLQKLYGKDGSTVDILTNEMDDMAFEGADWDFYWGDEPQSQRKFQAIMRGLVDRGGRSILTFTPLIEPWMKEALIDRADGIEIDAYVSNTRDNKFDVNGNVILKEEDIQRFESFMDDDMKKTRIDGRFFHERGIVYSMFGEVHQQLFEYEYPDPVICVLDPHDRQPHHVIWASIDKNDDIYVQDELSIHCTVNELAMKIRAKEKGVYSKLNHDGKDKFVKTGYKIRKRLIDPNFGRKPLITTGRNMIQELAMSGCPGWFEADDPKDEGRLKVKDYLFYNQSQPISLTNKPKMYFNKQRCPLTIKSIRTHQYEEWIGKIAGERDPKEKTKDKETHGADCVRYLCMSNPTYDRLFVTDHELTESPY